MIRSTKWLMVVVALGIVVGLASPAHADETKGKIKTITADTNQFVFIDKDGKDWTFQMDKNAKIQVGTKNIKLDELKVGDKVTVTYDRVGDKLIAKEVKCDRE
jgi:Cu/Ag efflux protein CusF